MELILEPFAGISGNMFLGLLLDLGGSLDHLEKELKKVDFDGYQIQVQKVDKRGVTANYVEVLLEGHHHHHDENHDHHEQHHDENHGHHHHRGLKEINTLIDESTLSQEVKDHAKAMFLLLGRAEGKIHNKTLEEVHFHEVGAVDSLVDTLGAAILMEDLGLKSFKYTLPNVGGGFVDCAHGLYPVPAPATLEVLKEGEVPFQRGPVDKELLTPTGAMILAHYGTYYEGPILAKKLGYGAGSHDLPLPNVLRGSFVEESPQEVVQMDCNLDNMTGEDLGHLMDRAFEEGALDFWYTPIHMKKNRPGQALSLLCKKEDLPKMEDLIFRESTSLGFRYRPVQRKVLERSLETFQSSLGLVGVKKTDFSLSFEFEDLKKISRDQGLTLLETRKRIERDYNDQVLRR